MPGHTGSELLRRTHAPNTHRTPGTRHHSDPTPDFPTLRRPTFRCPAAPTPRHANTSSSSLLPHATLPGRASPHSSAAPRSTILSRLSTFSAVPHPTHPSRPSQTHTLPGTCRKVHKKRGAHPPQLCSLSTPKTRPHLPKRAQKEDAASQRIRSPSTPKTCPHRPKRTQKRGAHPPRSTHPIHSQGTPLPTNPPAPASAQKRGPVSATPLHPLPPTPTSTLQRSPTPSSVLQHPPRQPVPSGAGTKKELRFSGASRSSNRSSITCCRPS